MSLSNVPWSALFGFVLAIVLFLLALGSSGATSLFLALAALTTASMAFLAQAQATITGLRTRVLSQEQQLTDSLESAQDQRSSVDSLAQGLDVALFVCDPQGEILYANPTASSMFRFKDPAGRSVLAVTLSHELEDLVAKAIRGEEVQPKEVSFSYPSDKTGIAKAWRAAQPKDWVFLSVYEVTDLRRLMRMRQDFVANVSHELRTPLTVIRAMAETLKDDTDEEVSPEADRYLGKIIAEVDRLARITQDLLTLSTAEGSEVEKAPCDIAMVLQGVLIQLEPQARQKGLQTEYEGPDHCLIEANESQMTQVAINLVQNAINYTAAGSITVVLQPTNESVHIEVRDTGIGMTSEHVPRIFERFYRIDKGRSRSSGGTGLGLSIVRHIVESHGGKIQVTTAINQGSTFAIDLPVGDHPPMDAVEPAG